MIRPWQTWLAFLFCLCVALAAMASISWIVLKLEQAQEEARERAGLEENVRLALWRMDSALTPLIAQENIRPYSSYAVPSPLLVEPLPQVLLYFQFGPDGKLTSPQVPGEMKRDSGELNTSAARLQELQGFLTREELEPALPPAKPLSRDPAPPQSLSQNRAQLNRVRQGQLAQAQGGEEQMLRNSNEFAARSQSYEQAAFPQRVLSSVLPAALDVKEGLMKPLWVGSELVLARRIALNGQEYIQGCWLDWAEIKKSLLENVEDLLPGAALEPVKSGLTDKPARVLAAIPAEIVPGSVSLYAAPPASAIRLSLFIAWVCVAFAALAAAVLLQGTLSLSERRGAFVSAVTHELRTPLTTFRMYAEMLAKKMVPDEEQRQRYLTTLSTEADRLSHLVENVLAYARIERGHAGSEVKSVSLGEISERVRERLKDRAGQAGMRFIFEAEDEDLARTVNANVAHVEQVLFNLVDNACKYAAPAADRSLRLQINARDGAAYLKVRDHGPGISRQAARRLFRPFSKSAQAAANSAPGVGLGLALSRRLARAMGGDLTLDESVKDGACFVLTLLPPA